MDRRHRRHRDSRVALPLSVRNAGVAAALQAIRASRRLRPAVKSAMGLMSFMTGGAAVVVTATLLALQVN